MYEPLATDLRPTTDAVLTIRVIKSFEFRTFKALILRGLNLETLTVGQLLEQCRKGGWKGGNAYARAAHRAWVQGL
jgi:hypothetical protein